MSLKNMINYEYAWSTAHSTKALLRSPFQVPTVEETLPEISNTKVFSVLNAKDGYHKSLQLLLGFVNFLSKCMPRLSDVCV